MQPGIQRERRLRQRKPGTSLVATLQLHSHSPGSSQVKPERPRSQPAAVTEAPLAGGRVVAIPKLSEVRHSHAILQPAGIAPCNALCYCSQAAMHPGQ